MCLKIVRYLHWHHAKLTNTAPPGTGKEQYYTIETSKGLHRMVQQTELKQQTVPDMVVRISYKLI